MNIPSNTSYNVSMNGWSSGTRNFINRVKQQVIDVMPSATLNESESKINLFKKIDEILARPAENRILMGATALITQPVIDYNNSRVDKETRTVSRNRTIAKIVAGTIVGVGVRGCCYKLVDKMTDLNGSSAKSKYLIPKKYLEKLSNSAKNLKNYKSALATGMAIFVMLFTNFLLDAPLTKILTNVFNEHSNVGQKNRNGGNNVKTS